MGANFFGGDFDEFDDFGSVCCVLADFGDGLGEFGDGFDQFGRAFGTRPWR